MAIKEVKKNKRGAPDGETRKKNRLDRLEKSVDDALLKGKETAAAHYLEYLNVLDKAARGTLKNVSVTGQISSAKVMKEFVENMMKEDKPKEESKKEEVLEIEDEEVVVEKPKPLISLVARG